eukprot:SAG11_NODE_2034_length_3897_cov_168.660611_2_plen_238_part_00
MFASPYHSAKQTKPRHEKQSAQGMYEGGRDMLLLQRLLLKAERHPPELEEDTNDYSEEPQPQPEPEQSRFEPDQIKWLGKMAHETQLEVSGEYKMMPYIKKQKEQTKSGDPMGCVHPAIQMELDSITSKIKIDETDPKVQELERILLKAEQKSAMPMMKAEPNPPELDITYYSVFGLPSDSETSSSESFDSGFNPIPVDILQLIKKQFDLKVEQIQKECDKKVKRLEKELKILRMVI